MRHRLLTIMILLFSLVFIATILVVITTQQEHDYHTNQVKNQRLLTQSAVTSIGNSISARQAKVQVFANQYGNLLLQLKKDPNNADLFEEIFLLLQKQFPYSLQTFSVADLDGHVYFDSFEQPVGDICLNDIISFSHNIKNQGAFSVNPVFIHPQSDAYHYDLMGYWRSGMDAGVILVSFDLLSFVELLSEHETDGYSLIVTHARKRNLVEFTSQGYRSQPDIPIHIDSELLKANGPGQVVPSSLWRVHTIANENFDDSYINRLWLKALYIFLIISAVTVFMIYIFNSAWRQHNKS